MVVKGFKFDARLCFVVLLMVGIGVVLIYSSSAHYAEVKRLPATFFLAQHIKKVILGLLAFLVGISVPFKFWERWSRPLLFIGIGLLLFLALTGFGDKVNGARRWIQFASFGLQPSELAKLAIIFYLARRLSEKASEMHLFKKGILATLPIVLLVFLLILKQPNYSTAATVLSISVAMIFVAGCRISHLLALGAVAIPALVGLMVSSDYRYHRVMAFLRPEENPVSSYQSLQALISLGHGGFLGTGPGRGTQTLGFLPMPFTDTVFSILGEEFGFLGSITVLALFAFIVWRGFRIAYLCQDAFGALVATGLSVSIAVNVAMHVGVCIKLFPTTGQPLPFISYGGTSLLANLFGMGILLNISGKVATNSSPDYAGKKNLRAGKSEVVKSSLGSSRPVPVLMHGPRSPGRLKGKMV